VYVFEVAGATLPWFCGSGSISLSMLLSTTPTEMLHRRLQLSSGLYYHYYNNDTFSVATLVVGSRNGL